MRDFYNLNKCQGQRDKHIMVTLRNYIRIFIEWLVYIKKHENHYDTHTFPLIQETNYAFHFLDYTLNK